MWYKNGIWCDDETDTDEDELPDYMELMLGTNISGTDSDSDGLPDYYESHIPIYNGGYMMTNTTLRDTDGDSLADGEEILITREYSSSYNNVKVTAVMHSDPRKEDSDFDLLQHTFFPVRSPSVPIIT